jgi:hypothetical protein
VRRWRIIVIGLAGLIALASCRTTEPLGDSFTGTVQSIGQEEPLLRGWLLIATDDGSPLVVNIARDSDVGLWIGAHRIRADLTDIRVGDRVILWPPAGPVILATSDPPQLGVSRVDIWR